VEQALAHDGAAKHRIVGAGNSDAGNFQDLVRERPLLIVQLLHLELRKARFLIC
jgi:hypothetical protein